MLFGKCYAMSNGETEMTGKDFLTVDGWTPRVKRIVYFGVVVCPKFFSQYIAHVMRERHVE